MVAKVKKCTLGPKHKWEWVKDVTTRTGHVGLGGSSLHIARRGVFKCACGERKYGEARSGL